MIQPKENQFPIILIIDGCGWYWLWTLAAALNALQGLN